MRIKCINTYKALVCYKKHSKDSVYMGVVVIAHIIFVEKIKSRYVIISAKYVSDFLIILMVTIILLKLICLQFHDVVSQAVSCDKC